MSTPSNQTLLRLFSKMPDTLQEEVFEAMIQRYHLLKPNVKEMNRAALYRQALLYVLTSYAKKLSIGSSKNHSRELDSLAEKSDLRSKMLTAHSSKIAKKREKLLKIYAPMIVKFKENEKRSFSWIQRYLAKYHKIKIDRTYLCKLYPIILSSTQGESNEPNHA
ncbi:hypothetical protein SUSP_002610 [Sulfurospirillum sp. 'SP']|nr:hypothetical protein [Sulfurospirillum sp. 'SP']WNZ00193.1 hypothetical protein SUSP_002610 [Sulfurospirillum sp. 'SP']